jgi:hypothetical protein
VCHLLNTNTLPYGGTCLNALLYYFTQSKKQIKEVSSEQTFKQLNKENVFCPRSLISLGFRKYRIPRCEILCLSRVAKIRVVRVEQPKVIHDQDKYRKNRSKVSR